MGIDREELHAIFIRHKGKIVGATFGLLLGWLAFSTVFCVHCWRRRSSSSAFHSVL